MNKPQLEEFMVFEDLDGRTGVIVKRDMEDYDWWKCYSDSDGGQVFDESIKDGQYNNIIKLYKSETEEAKHFNALKFMRDGLLNFFECVYDETKKEEEFKPMNVTINLTLTNSNNVEELMSNLRKELEKIVNCKY